LQQGQKLLVYERQLLYFDETREDQIRATKLWPGLSLQCGAVEQ